MTYYRINFILVLLFLIMNQIVLAQEYKVIVRAHHGIEKSGKQWQATIDVLNSKISEHRFVLVPMLNLQLISKAARQGSYDFLLTNPSSFVEIEQLYGAVALATLNNKRGNSAQTRFGSVIFTLAKNEGILSLNDLHGKTLMIANEHAFGGWRVAWLEMLEHGFNPYTDLRGLLFAKSKIQPEVVYAVRDGKVDAGVVRTDRLERMAKAGKIDMRYFRIINNKDVDGFPFFLSTRLYPEWPFAALKRVSKELRNKISVVLLGISKNSKAAKTGKYIGWSKPESYHSVNKLMQKLKVGAYANK